MHKMKNNVNFFLLFVIFFNSCKIDETIEKKYRQPFSHYSIGDTIFFKNNTNSFDTIRITSIDSFSNNGGHSSPPFKMINLKIEHLPINKWYNYLTSDETNTKLDTIHTDLIHLFKDQSWNKKNDKYHLHISYQDFSGILSDDFFQNKKMIDTILTERGRASFSRIKLKEESIVEVYWSYNKGMIGYKKLNGNVYELVD